MVNGQLKKDVIPKRALASRGISILIFALFALAAQGQIVDSTGSLEPVLAKLNKGDGVTTVLHIGDSHVQAGVWTGRVRELMQAEWGDAGRGLIVPHRLAEMNEAKDYAIKTPYAYTATKGGDTAVEIAVDVPMCEFSVWSKGPFDCITVLHGKGAPALKEPDSLGTGVWCDDGSTAESLRIPLNRLTDSLTLSGFSREGNTAPRIYKGFVLENGGQGVLYHAVGLNGAAFETLAGVARGSLKVLNPDLIIVSLGTNNCFGPNFREGDFYNVVDGYIRDLKAAYGGVPVLMTTPMEACRRGKPNPNVATAARVICEAAAANDVAFWDFYTATGGAGAMARWYADGLAARDRIHLTEAGYTKQGDMLFEEISSLITNH